ncbi:MAG: 50S ribosomal protein L24 [Dehalococcoidia bacterium]|nr:50S ribosomal protein L24 [Dehalococcoidia bacterium]
MNIKKNDNVLVIAGKDRGKKGKVHYAFPRQNKVQVDGINIIKKHTRPRGQVKQAGIIEREAPLDVSNVMLLCPKCNKPTRIGITVLKDGKHARFCKVCEEVLD